MTMRWLRFFMLISSLLAPLPVIAVQPDEVLQDPVLESRARALSKELRCMVCQNQSIDDSDAPLARDLRILVRERLSAGESDHQVLDFLTARYGEFVLLRPKWSWHTALLWLVPLIALLIGAFAMRAAWRHRSGASAQSASSGALTPAEQARLAELMKRLAG
jgi:cytochrome c-type biogenesis protein CcmH